MASVTFRGVEKNFGRFKVISVDYRMPPDHPFPAAPDDVLKGANEGVMSPNPFPGHGSPP